VEKKSKDSDDISDVSSYWTLDGILLPLLGILTIFPYLSLVLAFYCVCINKLHAQIKP
jgi:hypothetical protein